MSNLSKDEQEYCKASIEYKSAIQRMNARRAARNLPPVNESSASDSEEESFDIIQGGRCVVSIMPFMREYGELLRLIYGGSSKVTLKNTTRKRRRTRRNKLLVGSVQRRQISQSV